MCPWTSRSRWMPSTMSFWMRWRAWCSRRFIDRLLDAAFSAATSAGAERQQLVLEQERLAREVENLTKGIAAGGDIPALATALEERVDRLRVLTERLARPTTLPDRDALRAALELRTADWRGILRGPHVAQARTVLQHLLDLRSGCSTSPSLNGLQPRNSKDSRLA